MGGVPGGAGKNVVVCATGASGARLTARFLHLLLRHPGVAKVHFVASSAFELVLKEEEGSTLEGLVASLPRGCEFEFHAEGDLAAPVASGSYRVDATVVLPASMATVGAVASGAGRDLVHRACDVALKEGRPLILVPRETPLSLVHLRNLVTLKEAGASVVPFIPAFYHGPSTVEELMDHFLMRLFDLMGLETDLSRRWGGEGKKTAKRRNAERTRPRRNRNRIS